MAMVARGYDGECAAVPSGVCLLRTGLILITGLSLLLLLLLFAGLFWA
jgi:hypothetical protein